MVKDYDGELDTKIGELIEELKSEYEITDETKLAEHLYTYPQDYPDCTINDVRDFAYENIDEYRKVFGLKEAVDSLNESKKTTSPKMG